MNHLYVYALNNPIVDSDPRGLLTLREAFDHYLEGSRKPLRISFNDINTDKVYPELFPGFFELLKPLYKKNGSAAVDLKMAYSVPGSLGAVLGDITLRLEGEITSTTCNWKFKGTLKSYDDYYDFNPGNRGQMIETGTQIAREMDGAPYWIEIRGAKSISAGPFSWRWFKP